MIPTCAKRGVAYCAYSPLAGGWLTGKYRRGEQYPPGSRMTQRPEPYARLARPRTYDALEALERFAALRGSSQVAVALAWVLAQENVAQLIVGPARPEHLAAVTRGNRLAAHRRRVQGACKDLLRMSVLVLGHEDIHAVLAVGECEREMASVLVAHARGEAYMPLRSIVAPPGAPGVMGLMPAWSAVADNGRGLFAVKSLCLIPANPGRGLDAHQGTVTLFDGETGVPTAILDASAVTEIRTAAVTAVATRTLSREDSSVAGDSRRRRAGAVAPQGAGFCSRLGSRRACMRRRRPTPQAVVADSPLPTSAAALRARP